MSNRPRYFKPLSDGRYEHLLALQRQYQREARRSAKAKAYLGACVLAGAELEANLIAMCTLYDREVNGYLATLTAGRPPHNLDRWTLEHLIKVAVALRWLLSRKRANAPRTVGEWVELLRELRNLVHPGKHLRDYPRVRIGRLHYADARAVLKAANSWLLRRVETGLRASIERAERRRKNARK
jgi:hypothetical protein